VFERTSPDGSSWRTSHASDPALPSWHRIDNATSPTNIQLYLSGPYNVNHAWVSTRVQRTTPTHSVTSFDCGRRYVRPLARGSFRNLQVERGHAHSRRRPTTATCRVNDNRVGRVRPRRREEEFVRRHGLAVSFGATTTAEADWRVTAGPAALRDHAPRYPAPARFRPASGLMWK